MTIGLTLSGGGARGISHLGVLQALDELGIKPSVISGTSAGSLMGSLYAYGHKPSKILEIVKKVSIFKSVRPSWTWMGLLSMDGLKRVLMENMPENSFEALKIPFTVAATDLKQGISEYFSSGELIHPVVASACVPGFFSPVAINGNIYVDGGVLDNLPAKCIRNQCDFLVGVNCNPISTDFDARNLKTVIERSMLMAINTNTSISKSYCDLLIEPPGLSHISGFEIGKAKDIFDIGYEYAIKHYTASDFEMKR